MLGLLDRAAQLTDLSGHDRRVDPRAHAARTPPALPMMGHGRSMHRSAVQEYAEARLYPMSVGRRASKNVGASMTTVLTKSFPQEKPPVAKAIPGRKRVLIV